MIKENKNSVTIENNGIIYLEFLEYRGDFYLDILKKENFKLSKDKFNDLIQNSSLRNRELYFYVEDTNNEEKKIVQNLGFNLETIEYNPITNKITESYSYKYKDEFYVKDKVLEEILEKLNII